MNIGFSMHSPWPSTDIFKMFPYRIEVTKSLLCCDLISFHLFEYARNFYTGVARLLGHRHSFKRGGILGIDYQGRFVALRIQHIGIDIKDITTKMTIESTKLQMREFKEKLQEKTK